LPGKRLIVFATNFNRRASSNMSSKQADVRARPLVKIIHIFFFTVLWMAVLGIVLPLLGDAAYALRLASMPAPVTLATPVENLRRDALYDSWHGSRPGGRRHEGIDIFSRKGTPARATTEGIVLRRGHNTLGGNVVWVLGPGGQRHYYAHLDRFALVSTGERIAPGTVLGFVGNTGNARTTSPHLHYGIYGNNGAINPFPLLQQGEAKKRRGIK
jgi:murein DD-endopeptidase MepM/ murein hydrolase activator NlpD